MRLCVFYDGTASGLAVLLYPRGAGSYDGDLVFNVINAVANCSCFRCYPVVRLVFRIKAREWVEGFVVRLEDSERRVPPRFKERREDVECRVRIFGSDLIRDGVVYGYFMQLE